MSWTTIAFAILTVLAAVQALLALSLIIHLRESARCQREGWERAMKDCRELRENARAFKERYGL